MFAYVVCSSWCSIAWIVLCVSSLLSLCALGVYAIGGVYVSMFSLIDVHCIRCVFHWYVPVGGELCPILSVVVCLCDISVGLL